MDQRHNEYCYQKKRNGADQFYADYHEEYENRCQEKDRVSRVKNHNSRYPKMHDELDRRKSITKVTTIDGRRLPADYDPHCSACAKLITLNELQRKNVKHKCQTTQVGCRIDERRGEKMPHDRRRDRENDRRQIGDRRSRICKVKSNSHSRRSFGKSLSQLLTFSNNGTCKSIQCSSTICVRHEKSGTSNITTLFLRNSKSLLVDAKCPGNSRTSQTKSVSENLTTPGSKEPSISSYNSFVSITHEPMCLNIVTLWKAPSVVYLLDLRERNSK